MPEYLSPGVYVEEQPALEPIEGVSTSTTGFVGMTMRGPTSGPPLLVTSFAEFTRNFGGYIPDSTILHEYRYLPYAVKGFFDNLGKRAYIVRVLGQGNATATDAAAALGEVRTRLVADAASNAVVPAANPVIRVYSTHGIDTTAKITLVQVKNGLTTTDGPYKVLSYDDASGSVTLDTPLNNSYQAQYTTVDLTVTVAAATNFRVSAIDPGAWGNQIVVQIRPSSRVTAQRADNTNLVNLSIVPLASTSNFYVGGIVEFNTGSVKHWRKVTQILGSSIVVDTPFAANTDVNVDGGAPAGFTVTTVSTCEFDLTASWGTTVEQFRSLTMDATTPYYYGKVLTNSSSLLTISAGTLPDTGNTPFILPSAPNGLNLVLLNGNDGIAAPLPSSYIGADDGPGARTGIQALADALDISIVAVPGISGTDNQPILNALITHCETLRYRFAILDPAEGSTLASIQSQRGLFDTKYAAIYYPRANVFDPLTNVDILVPPSGHMAGIYAQTDNTRGVWKAPANVVIAGINRLEMKLTTGDQDVLNAEPHNINALRDFTAQDRGLRVYGARCMTSEDAWKYINVRRLFIFLEASLDQGTQWAVFEPNDQRLWARLTQSVSAFLTSVWREGGLMGSKAEEAFFVQCGYPQTMTQDDLDNGRLIMNIGVSPVYPAEFVIIRIGIWASGSSVSEV
jgi:phage tail sheath protein FI